MLIKVWGMRLSGSSAKRLMELHCLQVAQFLLILIVINKYNLDIN